MRLYHDMVKQYGYANVSPQVRLWTPYGDRIVDAVVWTGSTYAFAEAKVNGSRYGGDQQKKDQWLQREYGVKTYVHRYKIARRVRISDSQYWMS